MPDYHAPRWRPIDVLDPIRDNMRLLTPAGARRWRETWNSFDTRPPHVTWRLCLEATVDELALGFVRTLGPRGERLAAIHREADDAIELFDRRGWLDNPAEYHKPPLALGRSDVTEQRSNDKWASVTYPSAYRPHAEEPGASRWEAHQRNRSVTVHLLEHVRSRPWLILLHGAYMGWKSIDARAFDAERLHRELDLNIALITLPLHAARRDFGVLPTALPTPDGLDNVHGLAQAASDVRQLIGWLRNRSSGEPVGIYGMSLGAYVASLVTGLEGPLGCVIAGIPAVDFPSVFRKHVPTRVRNADWFTRLDQSLRTVHRVVSPLALPVRTPRDRLFIYAGRGDRVLHPANQTRQLWMHWGRPELFWFNGGHVSHVQTSDIRRYVRHSLEVMHPHTVLEAA